MTDRELTNEIKLTIKVCLDWLQWGNKFEENFTKDYVAGVFKAYYDPAHPFIQLVEENLCIVHIVMV